MPNRIIRCELLTSEAWLALKDNQDRAAYIACLLTADTLGNMPAGPHRLVHLWRPYGVDTPEKAAKVLTELIDVDLVRRYEVDGKAYLNIPRFKQVTRFLGHLWPIPPWATDKEKQAYTKKSQETHKRAPENHGAPPEEVEVEVMENLKPARTPDPVDNSEPVTVGEPQALGKILPKIKTTQVAWWETNEGVRAYGEKIGVTARTGESWADFKARVLLRAGR